jgi:hypothetical protein
MPASVREPPTPPASAQPPTSTPSVNPASPTAAAERHHVVLGETGDGDGMIFLPRQVEEGPDGNLYVLDSGDSFIKVYSPDGAWLRNLAGKGEGPGEFQRIDGASFGFTSTGQLFFTEFLRGHRWITILTLDGKLVRTLTPQLDVGFGIEAAASLDDGSFLVQFAYESTPHAESSYFLYKTPQSLTRIDSLGAVVSEIVRTEHDKLISFVPDGATTNLPWTPVFAWAPIGDDKVVWADGMSRRLRVLRDSGELLQQIDTALPRPVPVTRDELLRWRASRREIIESRNAVWWGKFGRVIEEYDEPLYDKPILRSLCVTPGGRLLVEGPTAAEAHGPTYWLLDPQGQILASATVAAWDVHLSQHFLLFFTIDDEELPRVHVMERPAHETEAIAALAQIVQPDQ